MPLKLHSENLKGEIYEYLHRELREYKLKLDAEDQTDLDGSLWWIAKELSESLCVKQKEGTPDGVSIGAFGPRER